jgi:DNA-binding NarL/FixJ family response regulator
MNILIVDDSVLIVEKLTGILREAISSISIINAGTYAGATLLLNELVIDLAMLDINLPDKSGIELLRLIKKEYSKMKVVMVSNNTSEQYRNICLRLGANYFFDKSRDFESIPAIVVNILQIKTPCLSI